MILREATSDHQEEILKEASLIHLMFFTITEIVVFGEPDTRGNPTNNNDQHGLTGLSALLFYSVFGYFVSKVKDAYSTGILQVRQPQDSRTYLYFKWFLRIFLEWAKAMAVILCIRDRSISYNLDFKYTLITSSYYVCTEKIFVELFIKLVGYAKLNILDCMEHLYVPIVLNVYALLIGIVITINLLPGNQAMYAMFTSYFIIYLRLKDIYCNYVKTLILEKKTFASFRSATENEIQKWDDICAVCLNKMSRAKITPCNHLFHPACLKHCLRTSLQCPLCKHDFLE